MKEVLQWAINQSVNWHNSGNLFPEVLEAIYGMATEYDNCVSAETGCGLSTIVLSAISSHHTCFTIAEGNSLAKVEMEPLFQSDSVEFVVGPSQRTLPLHNFRQPLHMALIDGAHGWPFAELDYYHFYPHIVEGGTLIVDDIHIPTIGRMYEVLRDDAMWEHVGDVKSTSFFKRTSAPLFDPTGDGWWQQNFNKKRFANPGSLIPILGENWWKV